MTAATTGINNGSRHGASEAGTYFHRTVTGGSRIRGGSEMIPNYSGHGMGSSSSHGPLRNPRTRVVVAPATATADAGVEMGVEVEVAPNAASEAISNAASEDEADDELFKAVRPAWVDDPDAGLPADERKYGEFTSFLDFRRLLDFLDTLRSEKEKEPSAPPSQGGMEELERLMRDSEGRDGDGGGGALGRFLDVLMRRGRDGEEGRRDDAAFDDFLKTLDADAVVEPRGKAQSGGEDWSDLIGGMSSDDERIAPDVLLHAYWRGIADPDRDPAPPAGAPAGWLDVLQSWFGRGAGTGEGGAPAGTEVGTAGAKRGEGDTDTVPSEDQLV